MARFSHRSIAALMFGAMAMAQTNSASAADVTIGFALPDLADPFWVSGAYGVADEASKLGVTVIKLNAGGDANASQQIAQIQDLIQRQVGAIIVGATNGDAVKAIVERAIAQGIPVIGFSSPPNTDKLASIISADHYDMGRLQAQCLAEAIGGEGEVAMIGGPSGQAWADLRGGLQGDTCQGISERDRGCESRTGISPRSEPEDYGRLDPALPEFEGHLRRL